MEQFLENIFYNTPFLAAFLAGFLTFLSPCILPLVPAYMSYISGQSLQNFKNTKKDFMIFFQALSFVLGFGLVFVLLGASMAKIIELIAPLWVKKAAGIVVILFGIHFLGLWRFGFLYKTKKYEIGQKGAFYSFLSPFVLGVSFSLGWTPCIGPIFTSIVLLSGTQEQYGLSLMMVYTIGLGIPFLLIALMVQRSLRILERLKKHFRIIEILSGLLLILLGIAIFTGWIDRLGNL